MIKRVIINVTILAVGAGIGYLVTKNYYEKVLEEEIEDLKEHFGRTQKISVDDDSKEEVSAMDGNGNVINFRNNSHLTRSSLDDNRCEQAKKSYNLVGKHNNQEVEQKDEENEEDNTEITDEAGMTEQDFTDLSKVNRTEPYLITDVEFSEEFDHHDKVSLYYYTVDDILAEENEEVIQDIEGTIGYEAMRALDMQNSVWVRNEPLTIDYEVIAIKKSYAEMIGLNLSPRERYEKTQKRREQNDE